MNSFTKIGLMLGGAYVLHSTLNKSQPGSRRPPQLPGEPPPYSPPVVVQANPAPSSSAPVVSGYPAGTFPMGKGSRSTHVAQLQTKLDSRAGMWTVSLAPRPKPHWKPNSA